MAEQYDVTEGQCPEDCPDVEVATYCINELQQVQNISRVNVKKCCPEDCPCDGEYNSEGCTLCGKCDGHPGFDLPKTFCVADTQPAQNVMRVNVNKTGENLWELNEGDILQPKDGRTFTIKKASEVNIASGSVEKYLNEQGDMAQVEAGQVKYTPSAFVESENVQDAITELGDNKQETLVSGTNIKTINGESILGSGDIEIQGGGSTDIISTNATNNTGIIVIDTTPNWQRVDISGSTLILDYANGILPTKNREYLLVINKLGVHATIFTLPTVSFVKNGITYNFFNTVGSLPINSGRSIEVNVIFFFIDATTCNIRTQITQFI